MIKKIINYTVIVLIVNIITYAVFISLRLLDIVSYYELSEDYESNLPIFILYFILPLFIILFVSLFVKEFKLFNITVLIEVFIFGVICMAFSFGIINLNCIGIFTILERVNYKIIHGNQSITVLIKVISPCISAFFYWIAISLGHYISHREHNTVD